MPNRLVIDASVAVKWFLMDEQDADLADNLLTAILADEVEAIAPDLFRHEVCAALTRACLTRQGSEFRLQPEKALECINRLFEIPIAIHASTLLASRASVTLGVHHAKGYYDMTYVNLAEDQNCQWCTAEHRVLQALRPEFPAGRVQLLSTLRNGGAA